MLEIVPKLDVVTRVFMLFKGVDSAELGWEEAKDRVATVDWRGWWDRRRMRLTWAYIVLEWGGMKVL